LRLGRKNKKYYKDLHQQAYDRLTGMQDLWRKQKRGCEKRYGRAEDIFFQYLSIVLETHKIFSFLY